MPQELRPSVLGSALINFLPRPAYHRLGFIVSLVILPAAIVSAQEHADTSRAVQEVRPLEPGKPIERELNSGEAHIYEIKLAPKQYLHVTVDQRGIDIVVTAFAPNGKPLNNMDSPTGTEGVEPISIVAEAAGNYRLEVRSLEKRAAPGRYEIKIETLRQATPQDRTRFSAEQAYAEAKQLFAQRTAASIPKAFQNGEEALRLYRTLGDRVSEAMLLGEFGRAYEALGERQKAIEYYHQAMLLYRVLNNRHLEAAMLNNQGYVYYALNEYSLALDCFQQALALHRISENRRMEAMMLFQIADVYYTINEYPPALAYYQEALPFWQALKDHLYEAKTINNIGSIYFAWGETPKALHSIDLAINIHRAHGHRFEESSSLINLGALYNSIGEYQSAIKYYHQAFDIFRDLKSRPGEALVLLNLGWLYSALGETRKALDFFTQALQIWRALGHRHWEASVLEDIGEACNALGNKMEALKYLNQGLALTRAIGDRQSEAKTFNTTGLVYAALGDRAKALACYDSALALARAVGEPRITANTLNNLGAVYNASGESQKALDYLLQALPLTTAANYRSSAAMTRYQIARAQRRLGNLAEARAQIEAALASIDSLRTKVDSRELRASFLASKQDYHGFYLDLLMSLHQLHPTDGYDAAALQASERARARSLLETLIEAGAAIRQGVDASLLERERQLQRALNISAERSNKLLSSKLPEERRTMIKREIDSLLIEYQQVQARIRATSPRYAALTQPQPLSAKEIQQQVLDDETILLEYALGEERSFLWMVTPTSLNSFELPKRATIDSLARCVYDLLTTRNQRAANETTKQKRERVAKADADYQKAAADLSRMLLALVADQLGTKRLLVVTDGALQYIPFGALPMPQATDYHPLVLDHEIVTLPSASVLAVLRREIVGRQPAPKTVAVLADPVFTSEDSRVKRNGMIAEKKPLASLASSRMLEDELERTARDFELRDTTGLRIPRLPFSRQEAEGIVAKLPTNEIIKALDFAANRTTATSTELSQFRIVHFATHGLLNSEHPELSGIVLSLVNENGEAQDGFLRLHEIYNLNLPADLVVLSACQTALGKEIKGEGLIGLTRGFMYAGAARVVASLWKVDDEATAELMKRFYQKMLGPEKLRPAAALRAAQVSMCQEKRWQSPYYWAAFVLQGEWK